MIQLKQFATNKLMQQKPEIPPNIQLDNSVKPIINVTDDELIALQQWLQNTIIGSNALNHLHNQL